MHQAEEQTFGTMAKSLAHRQNARRHRRNPVIWRRISIRPSDERLYIVLCFCRTHERCLNQTRRGHWDVLENEWVAAHEWPEITDVLHHDAEEIREGIQGPEKGMHELESFVQICLIRDSRNALLQQCLSDTRIALEERHALDEH